MSSLLDNLTNTDSGGTQQMTLTSEQLLELDKDDTVTLIAGRNKQAVTMDYNQMIGVATSNPDRSWHATIPPPSSDNTIRWVFIDTR